MLFYKRGIVMTENKNQKNGPKLNDQMLIRREKLEKIRALGVEPYGQKFDWDHHTSDIKKEADELEKNETHVRLAGRIMIRRGQGKTAFCVLRDQMGDIQLYFRRDELPELRGYPGRRRYRIQDPYRRTDSPRPSFHHAL